MAHLRA